MKLILHISINRFQWGDSEKTDFSTDSATEFCQVTIDFFPPVGLHTSFSYLAFSVTYPQKNVVWGSHKLTPLFAPIYFHILSFLWLFPNIILPTSFHTYMFLPAISPPVDIRCILPFSNSKCCSSSEKKKIVLTPVWEKKGDLCLYLCPTTKYESMIWHIACLSSHLSPQQRWIVMYFPMV